MNDRVAEELKEVAASQEKRIIEIQERFLSMSQQIDETLDLIHELQEEIRGVCCPLYEKDRV